LLARDRIDVARKHAQPLNHIFIQNAYASRGDRAHRQLLVPWGAELSHHEHVEWRAERTGDLVGDRNSAARKREHHGVPARIGTQPLGEVLASFPSISK